MQTVALFVYTTLLAAGGITGYLKAGSSMSLIMALVFGLALALCGWARWRHKPWSLYATLALLGFLACFFGWRLAMSHQLWPAGIMVAATLLTAVLQLPRRYKYVPSTPA